MIDEGGDFGGDGGGGHGAGFRILSDAGDGEVAAGDFVYGVGVQFPEDEEVDEGAFALFLDEEFDFDHVFEAEGFAEIAIGVDAGPADGAFAGSDGEAERAEEGVFGGLHVAEEVGVVDDAGHVGFREFDAAGDFEAVGQSALRELGREEGRAVGEGRGELREILERAK